MFKQTMIALTSATLVTMSVSPAESYQTFFGEDLNSGSNGNTPLSAFPNASQAEANFLSNLVGVGTEDFESFSSGQPSPLNLVFPGAGTATLNGAGSINISSSSDSDPGGAYPVAGDKNWLSFIGDGGFSVEFDDEIGAFGFYLSDLESTQLDIQLNLAGGGTQTLTVPNSLFPTAGSGSVFYYGLIADNPNEVFTGLSFLFPEGGAGDGVGIDDMTIGSSEQIQEPDPTDVPEPASLLGLAAIGAVTAGGALKKKAAA